MKLVFFISFCVALAAAKSYGGYGEVETKFVRVEKPFVPILKYVSNSDNYGTYNFETESADGTSVAETGGLKNVNNQIGTVKAGSYEWTSPEGERFHVDWTADENGFRPVMTRLSAVSRVPAYSHSRVLPAPLPIRQEHVDFKSYAEPAVKVHSNQYAQPAVRVLPAPLPIRQEHVEFKSYAEPAMRVLPNQYAHHAVRLSNSYSEPAIRIPSIRYSALPSDRFGLLESGVTRFGLPGSKTWGDFETPEFSILSSDPAKTFVRIGLP